MLMLANQICICMITTDSHTIHFVKSVQIRGYFWSVFSCIQSEYRKIQTRNNSAFGHFSSSDFLKKSKYSEGKYTFWHYVSIVYFRNHHQVFQEPEQSFYRQMLILSNAIALLIEGENQLSAAEIKRTFQGILCCRQC